MKNAFRVLRDRPTLTLRLTRDSVAAGDDAFAPHERDIEVHSFVGPVALVNHVRSGYLPSVAGSGHAWSCRLNGRLIATIQGNATEIRAKVQRVEYAPENRLHFAYRSASW
ncbi:MAG: hypothetical protein AAF809_12440 [Bacteroidota bacterium]